MRNVREREAWAIAMIAGRQMEMERMIYVSVALRWQFARGWISMEDVCEIAQDVANLFL